MVQISKWFAIYPHLAELVDISIDIVEGTVRVAESDALVQHLHLLHGLLPTQAAVVESLDSFAELHAHSVVEQRQGAILP